MSLKPTFFRLGLLLGSLTLAGPVAAQTGPGQTARQTLIWDASAPVPAGPGQPAQTTPITTFRGAYHGPQDRLGTFTLRLPGTVAAAELTEPAYEPFAAADARLLAAANLPAAPELRLLPATEARQPITYVLLRPARRNPQTGQPERLTGFGLRYQTGPKTRDFTASQLTSRTYARASVLSAGDWYKLGVPRSGVFKLDGAALQRLGLNPATLNPLNVQLYGNATGLLPQLNAAPRPDDLVENALLFVGNTNATLDAGEYFLFYARGPHVWRPSQPGRAAQLGALAGFQELLGEDGRWKHVHNHYADTAYYFLTVGARPGRRIGPAAAPGPAPTGAPITTFLDRRFYQHDLVSLLRSGRRWLGERLQTGGSRDFSFSADGYPALTDLVPGDTLRLTSAVANAAISPGGFSASTFSLSLGGLSLGTQAVPDLTGAGYSAVANTDFRTFTALIPAGGLSDPRLTLRYTSGNPVGVGYLDYLELVAKRQLRLSGAYLEFNSLNYVRGPGTVGTYTLANAAGAQVWDVTDPRRPRAQALDAAGSFRAFTDSVREFVALQPGGNFDAPRLWGRVPNQNLHALNLDGRLDLVIVCYPPFREQAERLAQHRRAFNGLQVAVVTTQQVYNEFSSGAQDATAIRDLMKLVYDRNPDPVARRNHLLLFGDASFDYKSSPWNDATQQPAWWRERTPFANNPDFNGANQNCVPTYESRESFLPVADYSPPRPNMEGVGSYSSEDYYGLLDDDEGQWLETGGAVFEAADIGVGRLPVRPPTGVASRADATQARQVVDKLIDYDAPASFGRWRNRLTLVADGYDPAFGQGVPGMVFTTESEQMFAPTLQTGGPAFNLEKPYLELFPLVSTAAGTRSPAANTAIDRGLEQGTLLWGYTGHGGPRGLSDKQLITNASVLALNNQHRLTFFVTGTCDLSTYDNPDFTSTGEQVLTDNPTGGAVGLFTTTRTVVSNFNTELVNNFYAQLLRRSAAGAWPYLGQVASTAKNLSPGGDLNNRNYTLLADPTTRLAYPSQRVVLDSINGRALTSPATSLDTLQALAPVRLSGHVERATGGGVLTSFGGTADITIFDKPVVQQTLGASGGPPVPVLTQDNVVYQGQASVRAGRFAVRFVMPKDINYSVGLGKVSLYAQDPTGRTDAQGFQQARVGALFRGARADTRPPRAHLFLSVPTQPQDTSFVSGGTTGPDPLVVARLRDESGINTSSAGIGHDITLMLDNDPRTLVVVNDAYTTDVDNFRAGTVRYQLKGLSPGPHTLTLKAWDTHNNSAETRVDFIVVRQEQLSLSHVLNYPNPFSNRTTFHFDHSQAGQELDVLVQIFTITGRLVKTLRANFPAAPAHVPATPQDPQLSWDGRDDYQDQLARGVYVYRLSVRSGTQTVSKFEKLVLLN